MHTVHLPIAETPVKALQYLAYPLCVLLNYEECLPWFYNNYIQLDFVVKKSGGLVNFIDGWLSDVPWLSVQQLQKKYLLPLCGKNLNRVIKNFIDDGWYLYSWIDEYYVPNRPADQKEHFMHDFMLYGYTDADEKYSLLGYTKDRTFTTSKISYKGFCQGFDSGDSGEDWAFLFKKKDGFFWDFNLKYVFDQLNDYYHGINTIERIGRDKDKDYEKVFGLDVYDYLMEYFELLLEKKVDFDIRSLQILGEHKNCMILRLKYMKQNYLPEASYFCDAYQKMANEIFTLRNLQVKYYFSGETKLIERIIKSLTAIKEYESVILGEMLELLEKKEEIIDNLY